MERTTSTILVSAWEAPDNKQGQRICVRQLWALQSQYEPLVILVGAWATAIGPRSVADRPIPEVKL